MWVTTIFAPWRRGWAGMLDWDFGLNPGVPLSLRLETGASEARLVLGDLQVRELLLKTGASSTTIDLPSRAGHTRVTVESGAAAVKIRVPQGVAASIVVRSTLAGVHVDRTRFPESAAGYRSPDFDSAPNKAEIFVETGVGSVEIYQGRGVSAGPAPIYPRDPWAIRETSFDPAQLRRNETIFSLGNGHLGVRGKSRRRVSRRRCRHLHQRFLRRDTHQLW